MGSHQGWFPWVQSHVLPHSGSREATMMAVTKFISTKTATALDSMCRAELKKGNITKHNLRKREWFIGFL